MQICQKNDVSLYLSLLVCKLFIGVCANYVDACIFEMYGREGGHGLFKAIKDIHLK
jgi:hypothetical protein